MTVIPGAHPNQSDNQYRWATVQGLDPLIIRLDGDTEDLAISPDSLVSEDDLIVGARVWCQIYGLYVVILGSSYHPPTPPPPNLDPEIDGTLLGNDYYEKYPNGLLICRGARTFPGNASTNQSYTWTFPVPFVGELPFVAATPQSTVPYNIAMGANDVTLNDVDIRYYRTTSAAVMTFYFAIGQWK